MNKLRKMEIIGKVQCSDCHFREACKHSMNNGGEDYCSVLIDYVSKEENSYTLKDLGFGDDDVTKATYVEVGGVRGYLGVIFGTEGDWNVILANVNEDGKIEYQTIKLDDLSEITEL